MTGAESAADADDIVQLVQVAERFLSEQWPLEGEQPIGGVPPERARDLWKRAAELGWAWIAQCERPEQAAPTLAALFGALGRHPAPIPLAALAISYPVLAAAEGAELLAPFADGERLLAFATRSDERHPEDDVWAGVELTAGRLTGTKIAVPAGVVADAFVVSASSSDGPCYVLVEREQPGVRVEPMRSHDRLDMPAEISLRDAEGVVLVRGSAAEQAERTIATLVRMATAAELAGLATGAVRLAVDYGTQRVQFGRPIAGFQAMKHLLADAWIDVYASESAALAGARRVATAATETDARYAADLALSFTVGASRRALETSLQAHGGIGFTLDYQLNWYFNRVLSHSAVAGSPRRARLELGRATVEGRFT
ncbi:acyl-CoA dehydrogenase family protein [Nocardia vaccinii]|uniref:acyl-CoA dehydrogenase family protein n=1 Tax=Nocardia vaccinii TaxID=1822 RepID=UPI000834AC40|nr:acyl-CoA dehydrogenase family protein [Nocardia vaccinii]